MADKDREDAPAPASSSVRYIRVHDLRPAEYAGTCLRPLGLCELGGCCDVCWYRPDHPRFAEPKKSEG